MWRPGEIYESGPLDFDILGVLSQCTEIFEIDGEYGAVGLGPSDHDCVHRGTSARAHAWAEGSPTFWTNSARQWESWRRESARYALLEHQSFTAVPVGVRSANRAIRLFCGCKP